MQAHDQFNMPKIAFETPNFEQNRMESAYDNPNVMHPFDQNINNNIKIIQQPSFPEINESGFSIDVINTPKENTKKFPFKGKSIDKSSCVNMSGGSAKRNFEKIKQSPKLKEEDFMVDDDSNILECDEEDEEIQNSPLIKGGCEDEIMLDFNKLG